MIGYDDNPANFGMDVCIESAENQIEWVWWLVWVCHESVLI